VPRFLDEANLYQIPEIVYRGQVRISETLGELWHMRSAISMRRFEIKLSNGARLARLRSVVLAIATSTLAAGGGFSVKNGWAQQSVADFYAGRQIKFIIRSAPGGGYDLYSRLLGSYLVRHIPGNPSLLPLNMPGAGGIEAANYMGEIAPQDGTYLTMIGQPLPLDQALDLTPSFKAKLSSFAWIGNITDSNMLSYTWHSSPVKTIEDARMHETTMGGTGAGSSATWLPLLYNKVLGTKFKLINGYQSGTEVKLAMERGEVEGYGANTWSALVSASPELVRDKLISILVQVGVHKEKDLPDVPLLSELARTPEDKAILEFISKGMVVGRPVGTTPGVPAERIAALRKAFNETMLDPKFIAEAAKEDAEIDAMDGATLQKIIDDLIDAPEDFKSKVKSVLPDRS
jgi:tripartite-type tricarboxylate transporter receptor subunit TctC